MRPRENPFRSQRIEALDYRLDDDDWDGLFERLHELDYRGAIVGPHGAGKTTLLEALAVKLSNEGLSPILVTLRSDHSDFSAGWMERVIGRPGQEDIVLFDSAERLHPIAWRRLRRLSKPARGLIIATHQPGRLPTLIECAPTPSLLDDLLLDLVPEQGPDLRPEAHDLFHHHTGNLRLVFRDLYDTLSSE